MKNYLLRQEKILSQMRERSLLILSASSLQTRSNDTEFPFRQESDFYYLTGFKEDNAFVILYKNDSSTKRLLFVQKKEPEMELWTGKRLGVDEASHLYQYDEVYSSDTLDAKLMEYFEGISTLYYKLFDATMALHVNKLAQVHNAKRSAKIKISSFYNSDTLTQRMRLIKDNSEIELIKKAAAISREAHHFVMSTCKVGKMEYELQAEYEYMFKKNGAYSDAYTTIVAGGNSANTLHYIANNQVLRDNELVLIDAGCEYKMYASDITRTFPVNGKFTDAQKEVYEKILDVEIRTIARIKPGIKKSELQSFSEIELTKAMVELSLLKGDISMLIEEKKHKKYYPHGIGHWMGIDVHDEAPYFDENGEEIVFEEGMILTIEPGLYIDANDEEVPEKYRGIGIRIEDDILVTQTSHEVLTKDIVKTVEAIETLMA